MSNLKSIQHITKENPNRWFLVTNSDLETGFVIFGNVGPVNETELDTGQLNIYTFLTEDELEEYVDNIAGQEYYKNAVENNSPKFQLPSDKYIPIIPNLEE
jgi:hypothetical protein